jgi:hypothetical protein
MTRKAILIRLDNATHSALRTLACERAMSMQACVERIILREIAGNEKAAGVLQAVRAAENKRKR